MSIDSIGDVICGPGACLRLGDLNIGPLHIQRVHGEMTIEHCLEDVFALNCLTWGQPEGCMRLPISIKLCDRSLFDEATDVNEDEIAFGNDNVAEGTR